MYVLRNLKDDLVYAAAASRPARIPRCDRNAAYEHGDMGGDVARRRTADFIASRGADPGAPKGDGLPRSRGREQRIQRLIGIAVEVLHNSGPAACLIGAYSPTLRLTTLMGSGGLVLP